MGTAAVKDFPVLLARQPLAHLGSVLLAMLETQVSLRLTALKEALVQWCASSCSPLEERHRQK